mmetsp:Transcript_21360/g.49656  ORF Transcript_21360/g.49656 Transcript_21360/m.49656 type:complete len:614 (+) Transcript_21360:142-1983(+)|eukprot:CAMPEP_0178395578 /NCGR_PEP_ID=MMETSP0689_2-20121128/13291_1 /TAXON_ID=160604 /ORGANISM="Amphidinium massartii, Strain CS-259" /LENGTH=613 /DNA_ID=CAMNT_0020016237 /DNA_START=71 /DNA_END=1912 /DNA_ORIENTATION=-
MIVYDSSCMGMKSLLILEGSVIPRALVWALPCGMLGCLCGYFEVMGPRSSEDGSDSSSYASLASFVSFNAILGFLVVFRSQQAYARYWEGLTLLQQVRGQWFNATSSLFAFCSVDSHLQDDVNKFRLLQVRLTSLLYCAALRRVAKMEDDDFQVIEVDGLELESLNYMREHSDPCVVILQWIQQLIVSNMRQRVLDIPAPVISRVFQELSQGIVSLADAQKISDTPFPFSSAQMIAVMMTCQWFLTPLLTAYITSNWASAGIAAFFTVFLISCLNLMASEIEMPFGDDPNDLPLGEMQDTMNINLKTLLHRSCNQVPDFIVTERTERNFLMIWSQNFLPTSDERIQMRYRHKQRYTKGSSVGGSFLSSLVSSRPISSKNLGSHPLGTSPTTSRTAEPSMLPETSLVSVGSSVQARVLTKGRSREIRVQKCPRGGSLDRIRLESAAKGKDPGDEKPNRPRRNGSLGSSGSAGSSDNGLQKGLSRVTFAEEEEFMQSKSSEMSWGGTGSRAHSQAERDSSSSVKLSVSPPEGEGSQPARNTAGSSGPTLAHPLEKMYPSLKAEVEGDGRSPETAAPGYLLWLSGRLEESTDTGDAVQIQVPQALDLQRKSRSESL